MDFFDLLRSKSNNLQKSINKLINDDYHPALAKSQQLQGNLNRLLGDYLCLEIEFQHPQLPDEFDYKRIEDTFFSKLNLFSQYHNYTQQRRKDIQDIHSKLTTSHALLSDAWNILDTQLRGLDENLCAMLHWWFVCSDLRKSLKSPALHIYRYMHKIQQRQSSDDELRLLISQQEYHYQLPLSLIERVRIQINDIPENLLHHQFLDHLEFLALKSPNHQTRKVSRILDVIDSLSIKLIQSVSNRFDDSFEHNQISPQAIAWPFNEQANHVSDTYKPESDTSRILKKEFKKSNTISTITYIPNSTISEDYFQIQHKGESFCVVVADGVSRSAFGGIAAQCVVQQIHSYYQYHNGIIEHDHILHILKMAKRSVQTRLYGEISKQQSSHNSLDSIMQYRIQNDGSQTVFSTIIYAQQKLLCCWAGNVRIIINTSNQSDSSEFKEFQWTDERFSSDNSRFSSHAPTGLHGTLNYQIIDLPKPSTVYMFTDALETCAEKIQADLLTDEDIEQCARLDDLTLIQIRIP
jgi:hypothetical protein